MTHSQLNPYRAILLIGPPGSGKGTQGKTLGQLPGYVFVSMGEVLRSLDPNTEPGKSIRQSQRAGELVPAQTVISVWLEHMSKESSSAFDPERDIVILDGLPRNIEQAELLQPHVKILKIIHFCCDDDETLISRIRQRDEGREDDTTEAVIRHRFQVYREQTEPLLAWYPQEQTSSVDATEPPLEVLRLIANVLTTTKSPNLSSPLE